MAGCFLTWQRGSLAGTVAMSRVPPWFFLVAAKDGESEEAHDLTREIIQHEVLQSDHLVILERILCRIYISENHGYT